MSYQKERSTAAPSDAPVVGELTSGASHLSVRGRALQLMLWIARRQSRINEASPDGGQLTLNWKGDHSPSIAGEIKTRL